MNDKKIQEIYSMLDTRITTINDRTKSHTLQIKEIEKRIKLLETSSKNHKPEESKNPNELKVGQMGLSKQPNPSPSGSPSGDIQQALNNQKEKFKEMIEELLKSEIKSHKKMGGGQIIKEFKKGSEYSIESIKDFVEELLQKLEDLK